MSAFLALAFFAQTQISIGVGNNSAKSARDSAEAARQRDRLDTLWVKRDSVRAKRDSIAAARRRAHRIVVTPQLLASAFLDVRAQSLLHRARSARLQQDSSLKSYDATTYERLSVGAGIGSLTRERLLLRNEQATRVRWQRYTGALVDVTGRRLVLPVVSGGSANGAVQTPVPIPYFPGRDALWIGSQLAKADAEASETIHPLANGAEAYYTYASGDSLSFRVPNRQPIMVRELLVRPRAARPDLVIGSLWFDVATGQLVRAVYRLAEPLDILAQAQQDARDGVGDGIPAAARVFMPSMTAQVDVVTIDYGLFEGRFWLPRLQTMEGGANFGPARASLQIQQRFDYTSVNEPVAMAEFRPDPIDTARTVEARRARREAAERLCRDSSQTRSRTYTRSEGALVVHVRVPCDTAALAHAPTLPPSSYDAVDTLFQDAERDAMVERALGLGQQGALASQTARVRRFGLFRYNRVEGLSIAGETRRSLGSGYTSALQLRVGTADLSPNGELSISRTNGRERVTTSVYRRLSVSNDWGNPLGLGASISALLFGRDDGLYYRTWGGEITATRTRGWWHDARLFWEQQFDADVETHVSLARAFKSSHRFRPNIEATRGTFGGAAFRHRGTFGEDPNTLRAFTDFRIEGAIGTFDYARGMLDLTLNRPVGPLRGVLTVSGGTSGGELPMQRLWYLGGVYSIRGQPAGILAGNSFWLGRAELGGRSNLIKPVIFADIGWAGSRASWGAQMNPAKGAGGGVAMLDGLIRLDVSKGVHPTQSARVDFYLDARF